MLQQHWRGGLFVDGADIQRNKMLAQRVPAIVEQHARPGAFQLGLLALCGLMSINGDPAGGPTRVGVPIVDLVTGHMAVSGVLMAVLARNRTGRGQRVEATLFDSALSILVPQAVANLTFGGPRKNRLFITASTSLYAIYTATRGAQVP